MRKIKYQGTITKFIAKKIADKNRMDFSKLLENGMPDLLEKIDKNKDVAIHLVSYSSKFDLLEQVLSICSFIRYVGKPERWTIYSDGTHSDMECDSLKKIFAFVTVAKVNFKSEELKLKPQQEHYREAIDYFVNGPLPYGKKMYYFINHPITQPTIFLDSDILFYDKSSMLLELINDDKMAGWFLPEWKWGTIDRKYTTENPIRKMYQVNSGFFVLNKELDYDDALEYLESVQTKYEHFIEQTVFHIAFNKNKLWPLDPRIFFLNNDDQFDFSYNFKREDIVIRHFTGPVRHKMWQRNWKWHLSI